LRLINQIKELCPKAQIVVTARSPSQALKLYEAGADYVLRPNNLTARHLLNVLERLLREGVKDWAQEEIDLLHQEQEILA